MVSRSGARSLAASGIAAILLAASLPSSASAACEGLLPTLEPTSGAKRPATADDILLLREIGQPDGSSFRQPSPLAVSPDGSKVAFVLTRADPHRNRYCRAVVVLPFDDGAPPRIVADAGEMILNETEARGSVIPVGYVEPVTPRWSSDGEWLAFLRRERGSTRLWRVASSGGEALALSPDGVDVEVFAFADDSDRLIYATKPAAKQIAAAVDREALEGWLYDERIMPNLGPRPQLPAGLPLATSAVDVTDGAPLSPMTSDRSAVDAALEETPSAEAHDGRRAWIAPRDDRPMSPVRLLVETGDGGRMTCAAANCDDGIFAVWWDEDGTELRFLRREGWAKEETVLYRWTPGGDEPDAVLRTTDVLLGCVPAAADLLCLRESSTKPRRLVQIDPVSGRSRVLFDPNPEFAAIDLGTVERLRWRNDQGREAWGDLVLPPDYEPGIRLPLIVVGYHSDGFLRGGTGNEFPIFAFAARGFAVLSTERPPFVAQDIAGIDTWEEFNAASLKDWAERRSLMSSVVTGASMVIARGIADPERVGITGLSDGASTARFALINSDMFAAASISSCCVDAQTAMIYAGIAYADQARRWGFPPATRPDPDYWRDYSLALNAARLDEPLLMQLSDAEYLFGLQSFAALREHGQPVELYVFPDEYHMTWQPTHRRAIYERNLDWFSFWLQGRTDPAPAKAAQFQRWEAMRKRRQPAEARIGINEAPAPPTRVPNSRHPQVAAVGDSRPEQQGPLHRRHPEPQTDQ